ncbi:MAG TPA: TIGR02996 domain-containing protein [Candidatus Binatia bacterium]|jgi:uncharacterized protein (TIGR02996 family)|nr:TIGR02996 domain-containing protein [Candidatus Binatia bacterium]
MSRHNRHLEDERLLVQEQIQDYAEQVVEEQASLRRQREFEVLYNAAATSTSAQLHGVLHTFLQAQLMDDTSAYHSEWAAEFFDQLRGGGLVSAVLANIAKDDADGQERSRTGARNLVPDHAIVWPVLRHVLAHPDEYHWRGLEVALKAAETYATDCDEAARLLAEYVREDSPAALSVRQLCPEALALTEVPADAVGRDVESARAWLLAHFVRNAPALAALSLSKLAPDTPGLAEVLIDAVGRDWEASARLSFAAGIGGAGLAAEALARLGPRGRQALPRLREAVLSDRGDWHSAADRRMAFAAYAALCEEDTAVLALLDEVAAKGCLSDALLDPVVRIAREKSAFVAVLARLVQSRFWTRGSDYSKKVGWIDTIELLSARGRDSEVVLPALAAALDRPRDKYRGPEMDYRAHAEKATRHFLDRLSAGQGARSPEDAFIVALRGVPSIDDAWLAYADWLEDRGDPRGEFLRLRQALARAGGSGEAGRGRELSQLRDTWLAAHGPGWAVLYDLVSEPIDHAP